ncbi:MAG: hypothetical protein FWG57_07220, partial [Endomicrobia bacterium]|nr:hypothetical protein [Endomicrobiia bacterium]
MKFFYHIEIVVAVEFILKNIEIISKIINLRKNANWKLRSSEVRQLGNGNNKSFVFFVFAELPNFR